MPAKPLPKLGQTRAMMDEFVRTGKVAPIQGNTESSLTGQQSENLGSKVPRFQGSGEEKPRVVGASPLLESQRQKSASQTVTKSYDIEYSTARRLRKCAYNEEIPITAIVNEALRMWLDAYEDGKL